MFASHIFRSILKYFSSFIYIFCIFANRENTPWISIGYSNNKHTSKNKNKREKLLFFMGNSFFSFWCILLKYKIGYTFDMIFLQCIMVGRFIHSRFKFWRSFVSRKILCMELRFIFFRFSFAFHFLFPSFAVCFHKHVFVMCLLGRSLMVGFKRYSFFFFFYLFLYISFILSLPLPYHRFGDIQYVVHLNIFHIFMFTLYAYIMYIKWGINLTLFMSLCYSLWCFAWKYNLRCLGKVKFLNSMFRNLYVKFFFLLTQLSTVLFLLFIHLWIDQWEGIWVENTISINKI